MLMTWEKPCSPEASKLKPHPFTRKIQAAALTWKSALVTSSKTSPTGKQSGSQMLPVVSSGWPARSITVENGLDQCSALKYSFSRGFTRAIHSVDGCSNDALVSLQVRAMQPFLMVLVVCLQLGNPLLTWSQHVSHAEWSLPNRLATASHAAFCVWSFPCSCWLA